MKDPFYYEVKAAVTPKDPFDRAMSVLGWLLLLAAIGSGIWAIVYASSNWERGIYGGFHHNDAENVAVKAMVANYGKDAVNGMRFANPPYVNEHGDNLLMHGQVRVIHIIGKQGVRYCVPVWGPENNWTAGKTHADPNDGGGRGINIGGHYLIRKGCHF